MGKERDMPPSQFDREGRYADNGSEDRSCFNEVSTEPMLGHRQPTSCIAFHKLDRHSTQMASLPKSPFHPLHRQ